MIVFYKGFKLSRKNSICIIGMGYVGATLAVGFANKGVRVYGVEKQQHIMEKLNSGIAPFYEQGFDEILSDVVEKELLTCHNEIPKVDEIDTYIITVGTPIGENNKVNESYLLSAVDELKNNLKSGDAVILRSTLKLGVTEKVVKTALDKLNITYKLAFCPERTVEGKAVEELTTIPQIIGGIDDDSNNHAKDLFSIMVNKCIIVASPKEAELCKLICNTQRDLYFGFANEVATICDNIGASVSNVIDAISENYSRVNIAKPGLVGGPCLTKDAHILVQGASEMGYTPEISLQGRTTNEKLIGECIDLLANYIKSPKKVSVLGLAFKGFPPTGDMRGSTVYDLMDLLIKKWGNAEYVGYDILATDEDVATLPLSRAKDIESSFAGADLVVLHNNHPDLQKMDLVKLSAIMNDGGVIYDFWNMYDINTLPDNVNYCGLGNMNRLRNNNG